MQLACWILAVEVLETIEDEGVVVKEAGDVEVGGLALAFEVAGADGDDVAWREVTNSAKVWAGDSLFRWLDLILSLRPSDLGSVGAKLEGVRVLDVVMFLESELGRVQSTTDEFDGAWCGRGWISTRRGKSTFNRLSGLEFRS